MYRMAMEYLREWRKESRRKPLLIRGARQVGKTYLVREFGKEFKRFLEINFEMNGDMCKLFKDSLNPDEIIPKIQAITEIKIDKDTLLFFDEVQACPEAILSLKYFNEIRPEIPLIAAGSLVEFVVKKQGLPVGKVRSFYLYPMNFYEFLLAKEKSSLLEYLINHPLGKPIDSAIHSKLLAFLAEYLAVGGMPEAVDVWIETRDFLKVKGIQMDIVDTYRQDFFKYVDKRNIKYVDILFDRIPLFIGEKFIFSKIEPQIQARELKKALRLLNMAGVCHLITHTSANSIPLGAEAKPQRFKVIPMDIGISQTITGEKRGDWFLHPEKSIGIRGKIVESFVGQELISYAQPFMQKNLFYWSREKRGAKAEVDYIEVINETIVPIEVKSGKKRMGKSLAIFLDEKKSPYGIIFSASNFEERGRYKIYPLYSIFKLFMEV